MQLAAKLHRWVKELCALGLRQLNLLPSPMPKHQNLAVQGAKRKFCLQRQSTTARRLLLRARNHSPGKFRLNSSVIILLTGYNRAPSPPKDLNTVGIDPEQPLEKAALSQRPLSTPPIAAFAQTPSAGLGGIIPSRKTTTCVHSSHVHGSQHSLTKPLGYWKIAMASPFLYHLGTRAQRAMPVIWHWRLPLYHLRRLRLLRGHYPRNRMLWQGIHQRNLR